MITLYGRHTSSNVQVILWALEELGLRYARIDAGGKHGGLDTPDFRAMNPNGKIPVLVDGSDAPIFETGAILRYLAARYGDETFWPRDTVARAQVDKWVEWAKLAAGEAFTGPIFWQVVRTPRTDQDAEAIVRAVATFEAGMAIADDQLARHPYLAGAALTPGDIMLGHVLYRYFDIGITRAELPNLWTYYNRLAKRPAYRKTIMVSYDELRGTLL